MALEVWGEIGMNVIRHGFLKTKLKKFNFLQNEDLNVEWTDEQQRTYLEEKKGERDLIELIEEMSLNEKVRLKIFSTLTYFLGLNASS